MLRFIKPHDHVDFVVDGFDSMNKDMIKSKFVRQCHYHVQVVLNQIIVRAGMESLVGILFLFYLIRHLQSIMDSLFFGILYAP